MTEQAKVPAIRFAGFTDPWEQRKLGELSSEFQSGDFISAEEILGSGPYPVYGGNGLRGYAKQYNHDGFMPYRSSRCVMRECQYCSGKGLFH